MAKSDLGADAYLSETILEKVPYSLGGTLVHDTNAEDVLASEIWV